MLGSSHGPDSNEMALSTSSCLVPELGGEDGDDSGTTGSLKSMLQTVLRGVKDAGDDGWEARKLSICLELIEPREDLELKEVATCPGAEVTIGWNMSTIIPVGDDRPIPLSCM
jgi:hypothetical protein